MDKILFYCTKAKPIITYDSYDKKVWNTDLPELMLNEKIAVECDCDDVTLFEMEYYPDDDDVYQSISIYDEFESEYWGEPQYATLISNELDKEEIERFKLFKESCLSFDELGKYVCPKGGVKYFYALHLSNVKIFDRPKELSDYGLSKAPQNMCYAYDKDGNRYWLLSIRSKYLDKIIKGEKTIEIRKRVLKELKVL